MSLNLKIVFHLKQNFLSLENFDPQKCPAIQYVYIIIGLYIATFSELPKVDQSNSNTEQTPFLYWLEIEQTKRLKTTHNHSIRAHSINPTLLNTKGILDPSCVAPLALALFTAWGSSYHWSGIFLQLII